MALEKTFQLGSWFTEMVSQDDSKWTFNPNTYNPDRYVNEVQNKTSNEFLIPNQVARVEGATRLEGRLYTEENRSPVPAVEHTFQAITTENIEVPAAPRISDARAQFNRIQPFVLQWEGLWVNDPKDAGGETYRGICRKLYPKLQVWKSLDALKDSALKRKYKGTQAELDEIGDIYYNLYYKTSAADKINNARLALYLYNFAVNAGPVRAKKLLQKAAGVKVDGIVGNGTLGAVNSCATIVEKYYAALEAYYRSIGVGNNAKFLKGWLNRLVAAKSFSI
ncbi:MAG: hypothetical protein HUK02_07330 [Bacteroidaceae bacterium]|nr:hypothetical protein [Bacteroidaceae bacterium]